MISPEWTSIWSTVPPADSANAVPAAFDPATTIKAVVLMTDGEYNVHYATPAAAAQALQLCTAMRNQGVKVYVIGFGFGETAASDSPTEQNARTMLTSCAGSIAGTYFFPYNKAKLSEAFTSIGNSLNSLAMSNIKVTQ